MKVPEKKKKSTNSFEKSFFKLMNNAVYGKMMENVEKRVNVKLLTHWENVVNKMSAGILIAKLQFHSCSVKSENLVAIQMNKTQITYDKPIYLGIKSK